MKLDSAFIKLCVCVKKIKLPVLGDKNGFRRSSHIYPGGADLDLIQVTIWVSVSIGLAVLTHLQL